MEDLRRPRSHRYPYRNAGILPLLVQENAEKRQDLQNTTASCAYGTVMLLKSITSEETGQ